jgi:drug/metabolite transporter (DMT)-like permease
VTHGTYVCRLRTPFRIPQVTGCETDCSKGRLVVPERLVVLSSLRAAKPGPNQKQFPESTDSSSQTEAMGPFLAVLSALVYGCADFLGGKATRRSAAATVTASSQLAGLSVLAIGVVIVGGEGPTLRVLAFGAVAGLAGAVGIILLYAALAQGTMSIVSPVTAVTAAIVPLIVGTVWLHERPPSRAWFGVSLTVVAIALVSQATGGPGGPSGLSGLSAPSKAGLRIVAMSVGAGAGFGVLFVLLRQAGDPREVGLWALVGARPISIGASTLLARRAHQPVLVSRSEWKTVASAGILDQAANVLYVLSIGRGLLSVLAVLVAMYPVSTVALARIIDGERLQRVQLFGVIAAFAALALVASA